MWKRFSTAIAADDLRSRCLRGGAILSVAVVFERAMRFVRSMILAKLISSADMGLVTLVAVVLTVFETAGEAGIRLSVIQNKQGDDRAFLNASWWFQSIRGFVLTILGVLCAGLISLLMKKPELTPLLQAAFLAVLFNALVSPASFLLEKHFRFGRYVVINQGTMLIGTVLTIVLAIWMRNAWPMIIGIAAEGLIKLVLSFIMCPFKPTFSVERKALRELFGFARGLAGMPLLTLGALYADVLVLGRMMNAADIGHYGMAALLARIPRDMAMQVAGKLLLPAFSARQDNPASLSRGLCQASRWMTLAAAPLAVFFIVWSKSILSLAFKPEYTAASAAFMVLAGVVFLRVHGIILWNFYIATAQLKQNRVFTVLRVIVIAALIVPMIGRYGMAGAAGAVLAGELTAFLVQMGSLNRHLPGTGLDYAKSLLPGLGLALILAITGAAVLKATSFGLWGQLGSGTVLLAITYLAAAGLEYKTFRK